jgi:hypothetical protein
MPALFFKKYWEVVGNSITSEVLKVLNGGDMPEGWNETCVVLIPKVPNPMGMKDLRPISLCNIVYKLISKVLANRLKLILPEIISPNQSAFVPGRLITHICWHTNAHTSCEIRREVHMDFCSNQA